MTICEKSSLASLNDDECKRVLAVIERDFQLRQKEYQRVQALKKIIEKEEKQRSYLSNSKEFNQERCIRCHKPFKFFFNPRQFCFQCQCFVCSQCSVHQAQTKLLICRTCSTIKELERLTADWFYHRSSEKYKRCGSAKVVRELHKREKDFDEDLGYGTLPISLSMESKDSAAGPSYVIRDQTIKSELEEYAKRLVLLVDRLLVAITERHSLKRENLKMHQQNIAAEINRARVALSKPLRRMKAKPTVAFEMDLQNLLIQQTEFVLQTNLPQWQKDVTKPDDFDAKLAQIIVEQCVHQDLIDNIDTPPLSLKELKTRTTLEIIRISSNSPKDSISSDEEKDIVSTWF